MTRLFIVHTSLAMLHLLGHIAITLATTGTHLLLEIALNLRHRSERLNHRSCLAQKLRGSLVSFFDEEIVNLFERQLVGLWVAAVGRVSGTCSIFAESKDIDWLERGTYQK